MEMRVIKYISDKSRGIRNIMAICYKMLQTFATTQYTSSFERGAHIEQFAFYTTAISGI